MTWEEFQKMLRESGLFEIQSKSMGGYQCKSKSGSKEDSKTKRSKRSRRK